MGRHSNSTTPSAGGSRSSTPIRRRTFLAMLGVVPVVAVGGAAAVRAPGPVGPSGPVAPSDPVGSISASHPASGPLVAPAVPGTRYFVSPDGDDAATGTDVHTPWRTIDQVNRRMADGTIGAGDAVLFRSGATFFGKIRPGALDLDAHPDARLLISSYATDGATARPVISSYKLLDVADGWRLVAPGEWVVDLSSGVFGRTHHGYSGVQGGADNIGFLRVDGVVHGRRCTTRAELADQWDFYCDGAELHVRSATNPTGAASDLRAACGETCVELTDGLEMRGLRVEGGGGHGAQGSVRAVQVVDNELAELGGSLLDPRTRYGNGIEIWIGSSDVEVSRNVLHDIYDVGLTIQGDRSDPDTGWSGVTFTENLVYRCNQSVELWSSGPPRGAQGFSHCVVSRNVCLFAGQSWSASVRPDQDTKVHLLTYGWTLPADISVVMNVFHDAVSGYRWAADDTPGLVTAGNIIRLRPGGRLSNQAPDTVENGSAWAAATGTEQRSSFVVLDGEVTTDVAATLRQIRGSAPLDDQARALLDTYTAQYG